MFGRKDKRPVFVILLISILLISSISFLPGNSLSQPSSDPGLLVEFNEPTGGEVWTGSTEHNISWTLNTSLEPSEINLTISYSYQGRGPYLIKEYGNENLFTLTSNYTWDVPDIDSSDVKIIIQAEGGGDKAWNMVSLAIDSTSPQFISTEPKEGGFLLNDSSIKVTFSENINETDFENIFSLYRANKSLEGNIEGEKEDHNYTVRFKPNNTLVPSDEYYLDIDGTISDLSDPGNYIDVNITINFTVRKGPPKVHVTTSVEEIRIGNSTQINWTVNQSELAPKPISIYYSIDGGDSWITIASEINNKGTFDWTVPEEVLVDYPVDQAIINISCENIYGYEGNGYSSFFNIFKNKRPKIEVERPYRGMYFVKGQKTRIKWDVSDDISLPEDPITISVSTDNGISWRVINHNIENDGDYLWQVDNTAEKTIINVSCTDKDGAEGWAHSPIFSIVKEDQFNLSLEPMKKTYRPTENIKLIREGPAILDDYDFMRINLSTRENNWRTIKEVKSRKTSAVISLPFAMSSHCKIGIEVIGNSGVLYEIQSQEFEIFPSVKNTTIVKKEKMTMIRIEFESDVDRSLMGKSLTLYRNGKKRDISMEAIYTQTGSDIVYITKDLPKGRYKLEFNSSYINRDFKNRVIFTFEEKESGSDEYLEYWPILLLIPIIAFLLYHYRKRLKPTEKTSIDKVDIEKHQNYKK